MSRLKAYLGVSFSIIFIMSRLKAYLGVSFSIIFIMSRLRAYFGSSAIHCFYYVQVQVLLLELSVIFNMFYYVHMVPRDLD